MELIIAFIVKFITVIYGAIYGLLASIPVVKEWVAMSRIKLKLEGGAVSLGNHGRHPILVLEGHVLWQGGEVPIARQCVQGGDWVQLVAGVEGEARMWIRVIDMHSGKELSVVESVAANRK